MASIRVKALADLAPGAMARVAVEEEDILLVHLEDGVYAVSDICSHARVSLSGGWLEGDTICCPKHGGKFDARTGCAIAFPAFTNLRKFPASVRDGQIYVEVDE